MAVSSNPVSSSLSLKYKSGIDATGKDVFSVKKFANVKVGATDQDVFDTANALAPLMQYPIAEISRVNDNVLING